MLYVKNVPKLERVARVALGVAAGVAGWMLFGGIGALVGAAGGAMFALTGLVGYCPACAMIGRKPVA